MTAIAAGTTTNVSTPIALVAPPDHLWRRILSSRRAVWGGAILLLVLLLCLGSWPWTRTASTGPLQFNRQHDEFARVPPSMSGRPADMTVDDWNALQKKLAAYEARAGIGHMWRWLGTDARPAASWAAACSAASSACRSASRPPRSPSSSA